MDATNESIEDVDELLTAFGASDLDSLAGALCEAADIDNRRVISFDEIDGFVIIVDTLGRTIEFPTNLQAVIDELQGLEAETYAEAERQVRMGWEPPRDGQPASMLVTCNDLDGLRRAFGVSSLEGLGEAVAGFATLPDSRDVWIEELDDGAWVWVDERGERLTFPLNGAEFTAIVRRLGYDRDETTT